MITTADLKAHTKTDLAKMAKRLGIAGCSVMRKDELVTAVAQASRGKPNGQSKKPATGAKASNSKRNGTTKHAKRSSTRTTDLPPSRPSKSTSSKRASSAAKTKAKPKHNAKSMTASKRGANARTKQKAAQGSTRGLSTIKSPAAPQVRATKKSVVVAKPSKVGVAVKKKKQAPKPKPTNPKILKRIRELQLQRESDKDIAFRPTLVKPPGASEPVWEREPKKDRIALFVRDAYWMHASWDITRQAIERAKAAMAEQWHAAKPMLRLLRLDDSGTTNTSETVERDIEIHGGLRNWYIAWSGESANFRVMIGYLGSNGRFHAICESNTVHTPAAGTTEVIDEHWASSGPESEKIFALSGGYDAERETSELQEMLEERLHRHLGAPALARLGASADGPFGRKSEFHFDMDIELVLFGSTVPDGYLTLNGEPVALREDGTFVLRLPFPDRRQVLPAVACSRDGGQQRTIVVAVERNTKIMEPLETEHDTGE